MKTVFSAVVAVVAVFAAAAIANDLVVGDPNLIQSFASGMTAGAIILVYRYRKNTKPLNSETNSPQ